MSLAEQRLTPAEYLARERAAECRSEYYNGKMYAMSGATEPHNLIVVNLAGELHNAFKGRPCKIYLADMRVKVSATGLYTYPDAVALCHEARFEDGMMDTLINPAVVFEVLSPSTEAYDRGEKFAHYRRVETVTDYVMISQDRVRVEHYARQADGRFLLTEWSDLNDSLELPALRCRLVLRDLYDKVSGLLGEGDA